MIRHENRKWLCISISAGRKSAQRVTGYVQVMTNEHCAKVQPITTRSRMKCELSRLDTRGGVQPDKAASLKIALIHKGRTVLINLGVRLLPGRWNSAAEKVVVIPNRQAVNTAIANRKLALEAP